MNDNTLFGETSPTEPKSYFSELVGPNQKFKDQEELAKGKWHADATIAIANKRLDDLQALVLEQRKQIDASKSLEQLLDQLQQHELANSKTPLAKEVTETKLDPNDLKSIVQSQLKQARADEKAEENIQITRRKLQEMYGDKAGEVLKRKQEELGLSGPDVLEIAKKSPDAALNILGLNNQQTNDSMHPPRSALRNDNFKPTTDKRTWAWYKAKYKNRDFVANKELNTQMAKDAAELGDAFFDGDFYNAYHKP